MLFTSLVHAFLGSQGDPKKSDNKKFRREKFIEQNFKIVANG